MRHAGHLTPADDPQVDDDNQARPLRSEENASSDDQELFDAFSLQLQCAGSPLRSACTLDREETNVETLAALFAGVVLTQRRTNED